MALRDLWGKLTGKTEGSDIPRPPVELPPPAPIDLPTTAPPATACWA